MRFRRLFVLASAIGVASLALAPPAGAAPKDARLRAVHSWAFAIGNGGLAGDLRTRYAPYDLVVVDGELASTGQVATLRGSHHTVLAYLSVGTVERYRRWYTRARRYRLDLWGDWGEWYANARAAGYRRLMLNVSRSILAKGFDGLFLDNTDMPQSHPDQAAGMANLVRSLATLAHRGRKLLFTQNGEESIGPLLRYYDGWNREDVTYTYDFARRRYQRKTDVEVKDAQAALRRISAAGLLVTSTDYVAAADRGGAIASIGNSCAAGALPFVSDIGLGRIPVEASHCGASIARAHTSTG